MIATVLYTKHKKNIFLKIDQAIRKPFISVSQIISIILRTICKDIHKRRWSISFSNIFSLNNNMILYGVWSKSIWPLVIYWRQGTRAPSAKFSPVRISLPCNFCYQWKYKVYYLIFRFSTRDHLFMDSFLKKQPASFLIANLSNSITIICIENAY